MRSLAWIASWLPPLERIQPMQSANSVRASSSALTLAPPPHTPLSLYLCADCPVARAHDTASVLLVVAVYELTLT